MMSKLGEHFRMERESKGMTLGELARLVGYRNASKGARRISLFEREGTVKEDLLLKLAEVMGIDWLTVIDLEEQDRRAYLAEWERWASEVVPMVLIARLIPAVYKQVPLPPEVVSQKAAEAFAREFAREHAWRCCLVVSRRLSVWIGKDGEIEARTETKPGQPNVPGMTLKANRQPFLMSFGEHQQRQ